MASGNDDNGDNNPPRQTKRERDTNATSSSHRRSSFKASAPSASRSFANRTSSTVVDTAFVPRASSEPVKMVLIDVHTVTNPVMLP